MDTQGWSHYTNKSHILYCFSYHTSLQLLASFSASSEFNIPSPCQGLLIINSKTSRKCRHVVSRYTAEKWAIGKKYLLFLGFDPMQTFSHANIYSGAVSQNSKTLLTLKAQMQYLARSSSCKPCLEVFIQNMVIKINGVFQNQFALHKYCILKQQNLMARQPCNAQLTTFSIIRL